MRLNRQRLIFLGDPRCSPRRRHVSATVRIVQASDPLFGRSVTSKWRAKWRCWSGVPPAGYGGNQGWKTADDGSRIANGIPLGPRVRTRHVRGVNDMLHAGFCREVFRLRFGTRRPFGCQAGIKSVKNHRRPFEGRVIVRTDES